MFTQSETILTATQLSLDEISAECVSLPTQNKQPTCYNYNFTSSVHRDGILLN